MNSKQKFKGKEKIIITIVRWLLFFVLACSAVRVGILGGSILSSVDSDLIKNIDVGRFRTALNNAFPIIDTIYNSGNISISFTGEINNLIKGIFGFEVNNPVTILNAESPYVYSYYENDYQRILAQRDNERNIQKNEYTDTDQQETEKMGLLQDQSSIYMEQEDSTQVSPPENNAVSEGKITVHNETKEKLNIDELLKQPLKINFDKKGPQVLIVHTHTTEGYINSLSDLNNKNAVTSSRDPRYSVVRVGDEIAEILRKKYGIEVVHNGTVHDYPDYNKSYTNCLSTVTKILKSYPSIKVVLDIHRDGLGGNGQKLRAVKNINGKNAAQVMFVVGSNATGLNHPNWKENLAFAVKLEDRLNSICPGLAKPIFISRYRYNQHVTNGAIIIEVGGDGNLLSECIESAKYIAQAINDVLFKK
jgi:stage II sporulation protein P